MKWICYWRGVWRDLKTGVWLFDGAIKGHEYVEQHKLHRLPKCVQVLKCKTCGDFSVTWQECDCEIEQ